MQSNRILIDNNSLILNHFLFFAQPLATYSEAHSDVFIVEKRNNKSTQLQQQQQDITNQQIGTPLVTPTAILGAAESCALFAMKRQHIGKDGSQQSMALLERAYRELRIMLQLAQLHADSRCAHFVQLVDYVKAKPPLLFPGRYEPDDVFMYYVLEYAAVDLHTLRSDAPRYAEASRAAQSLATTPLQTNFDERVERMRLALFDAVSNVRGFTALVFQMVWALACAQKRYSFVHNDLHMKNVLLCLPELSETCQAYLDDSNQCWFTDRLMVKIADFGLSRLTLAGKNEVLYNTNNSFSELFDPARDLVELSLHLPTMRRALVPASASSDQDTLQWRAFVTALKRAPNAKVMLSHQFFDVLKQSSPFMTADNTRFQCFNGADDVPRLRRHVRNLISGNVDPSETIGASELVEVARLQATDQFAGVPQTEHADGKVLRSQRRGMLAPQYVLSSFVRKVAPARKAIATTKRRPYKKRKVASAVVIDSDVVALSPQLSDSTATASTAETPNGSQTAAMFDEALVDIVADDDAATLTDNVIVRNWRVDRDGASLLTSPPPTMVVVDEIGASNGGVGGGGALDEVSVAAIQASGDERRLLIDTDSLPAAGVATRRRNGDVSKNKADFRAFRDMSVFLEHGMRR
jgi:hypothetical protein